MWKKMGEKKEAWASEASLVKLLAIKWKKPNHGSLMEFLNIFVIKRFEIYFGRKVIVCH
jgi:hypothetical protein